MAGVRTMQNSSLDPHFFSIPDLLLPVTAPALDRMIASAEPSIGFFDLPFKAIALPTVGQGQTYILGSDWHSIRFSESGQGLPLTVRRTRTQFAISIQKPLLRGLLHGSCT